MFIGGLLLYPSLPSQIPTHWGLNGQVNGWMPKEFGVWLLPIIAIVVACLLPLVRYIDPYKDNYVKFEDSWLRFQLFLVIFFAYIYALTLGAAVNAEISGLLNRAIIGGVGILFILLGNMFGKIRHNFFVGIRTPWTLADEDVWNRTHRLGGWLFVIAGLLMLLVAALTGNAIVFITSLVIAVVLAAIVPTVYSYVIFQKKHRKGQSL